MIHAYKEINEVVGLNGWIVISCCFNHDVHPCEDVFPMSSPWIIVYINIIKYKYKYRERERLYFIYIHIYTYIYIYMRVCVCDCMCIYYIYIFTHTYTYLYIYICTPVTLHKNNMAIAHKTQRFQDQTFTQTPPESVLGSCNHCWPSDTTSCLRLVPLKIGAFEALYDIAKPPKG